MMDLRSPPHAEFVNSIGLRLKLARAEIQMTQKELGRRLGVSQGYISAVENGKDKANIEILVGWAIFFPEIDPDWLLTGRGAMKRLPASRTTQDECTLDTQTLRDVLDLFGDELLQRATPEGQQRLFEDQHYFIGLTYRVYMAHFQAWLAQGIGESAARENAKLACKTIDTYNP